MIVSLLLEHKMHMTGPVAMPLQQLQQLAHGSIMRDRVGNGDDRLEPKVALLIALHHRPLIWPFSSRILHVVEPFAVRLPNVDLDALDRPSICIFDCAQDKAGFAVGIVGDCGAVGFGLRFVGVEGPKDCAFGAGGWLGVVDAVDKEGKADDVGEQDKFLET